MLRLQSLAHLVEVPYIPILHHFSSLSNFLNKKFIFTEVVHGKSLESDIAGDSKLSLQSKRESVGWSSQHPIRWPQWRQHEEKSWTSSTWPQSFLHHVEVLDHRDVYRGRGFDQYDNHAARKSGCQTPNCQVKSTFSFKLLLVHLTVISFTIGDVKFYFVTIHVLCKSNQQLKMMCFFS